MKHKSTNLHRIVALLFVTVVTVSTISLATDPPDSAVSPQTGDVHIADPVTNSSEDIDYVIDPPGPQTEPGIYTLADHSLDDRRPRLVIASNGDSWVVWWRDDTTDKVIVRKRTESTGSWTGERDVSESDESSRSPRIVHDGTDAWVAFEFDDNGDTSIGVTSIIDDPDPIPSRTLLGTTGYSAVDVQIHEESGHLWVTWVDSSTLVGWSEFDYTTEAWGAEDTESYATDTVADARRRIRDEVIQ